MPDPTPPRIDRATLDRIIQRATELQTGERNIGEGLTSEEVLALGKDVGIPARYLQQAMLEERSRSPAAMATGFLDRLIGPAEVEAQRVVRGAPEEVERLLLDWIEENELLAIQRQQPGRITWEPLHGFQAAMRRSSAALGGGKRPFMLSRASLVGATISPLEPGYCHVSLSASLGSVRGSMIGGAMVLGSLGVAGAAAITLMSPFLWVAAAPLLFFSGLGYVTLRQFRPIPERLALGLERALDHLERGEIKATHALPPRGTGMIRMIADEVRRALNP